MYIWGYTDARVMGLADDGGVAFQLTNILRDLREDWARGRVYLPAEDLARFEVDMPQAMGGGERERFGGLMDFQIGRAREIYERSAGLEELIEADSRPTLRIMTEIYRGILEKIAKDPAAVLRKRVTLSSLQKMRIVARNMWLREKPGSEVGK